MTNCWNLPLRSRRPARPRSARGPAAAPCRDSAPTRRRSLRPHRAASPRRLSRWSAPVERHEALRVLRGGEDRARILDADHVVGRRMHHQQRLAQLARRTGELLLGDIVEELLADAERAAGERDLRLARLADVVRRAGGTVPVTWRGIGRAPRSSRPRAPPGSAPAAASTAAPPRL